MKTEKKENSKKKKSFLRKLFEFVFITTGALITILICLLIFIQTSFFKNWLLHYVVNTVNESLVEKDSKMYAGSIEGSIVKGFTLKNAGIIVKQDTMLKFSELDANYSLYRLFKKEVYMRNVELSNLQGNFTKVKDKNGELIWNFEYLLKKEKTEEDTAKKEFDWKITVKNFELTNAAIRFLEEKKTGIPFRENPVINSDKLDLSNLDVSNLNLKLSGYYHPDEKFVNVKNISFTSNSSVELKSLTFEASILQDNKSDLKNFHIVTARSDVIINEAYIENLNPLKEKVIYENFKNKNAYIDIIADRFDIDDLVFFLPDLKFLDGKAYLELKADGKYDNINIRNLVLKTDNSDLTASGRVVNLNAPEKLYLDVNVKKANLDPSDTKKNLPGIPIPDYSHVGKVNASFTFKGEPLKFNTNYEFKTSAGEVKGETFLDLSDNKFVYNADFTTKNLNIGKIIEDDKLNSNINAGIKADGKGFDYKTLTANVNFDVNNSDFYGQKISKSNGIIKANSGNLDVDLNYSSNSLSTKIQGDVNIRDIDNPKYDLKGTVQNLDVSTFTKNDEDKSNLNFTFDVKGEGYNPDDLNGSYDIGFTPSKYQQFIIPQTRMIAKVTKSGDERQVNLISDVFDFDAKGKFSFTIIPGVIASNLQSIAAEFKKEFVKDSLESDFSFEKIKPVDASVTKPFTPENSDDFYLRYNLTVKNFYPVHLIIKDSSIVFNGKIHGEVAHNKNNFNVIVNGELEKFRYLDSTLMFSKGILELDLKNNTSASNINNPVYGNLSFKANDLIAANKKFDTVYCNVNYGVDKGLFLLTGNIDTTLRFQSYGRFSMGANSLRTFFDTLNLGYKNYYFANRLPVKLNLKVLDTANNDKVIDFESFRIVSDNQRMMVNGYYSFSGNSNLNIRGQRIKIAEIQKMLNPEIDEEKIINGELRRFLIKYTGNLDDPELYAELNTEVLGLQKVKLGRVDAIISYNDNTAFPQISFSNVNNEGNLQIKGEIPLQNPLQNLREKEQHEDLLENDINLKIASQNFQINILEQIIPVVTRLRGNMNGNIDVKGKVKRPLLSGNMNIKNGKFKLLMTGMNYNFTTDVATQDQRIVFPGLKIYVPYEDDNIFTMRGYLDFTNLEMNDMELSMDGKIKVLDNNISQNILGVYGDLYAKTGDQSLVLKGNSDRLDMTGNLIMTKGRIYIPPFKKEAYSLYADNFIYKILFDSTNFRSDSLNMYVAKLKDSLKTADKKRLDPFDNNFLVLVNGLKKTLPKKSPFFYDVSINTEKKLYVNLIIDEKTGQEFFGNVNANLTFDNKENDSIRVRGRVTLEDNCYYKFYKNFEATGSLIFNGNIINPELSIEGKYNSVSVSPSDNKESRTVNITLKVTGQTLKPVLRWEVLVDGSPKGDPDQEAVSFIVFGKFTDELNADQRMNLVSNIGANVGTSFVSQYLTNIMQSYLPFIVNTDINYNSTQSGNVAQNTDIRITAELGDATIRFGGQIFRDLSNTNIAIEYPLNKLLKMKSLSNNLVIQFERIVDPFSQNKNLTGNARTGGSVYYKIKF